MNKILLIFAHPAVEKSRVQARLFKAACELESITGHDLYEAYPSFMIRVEREQQLLREHDIILLQHPLYWYSSPALLKEWQDLVLEYGFAYGRDGIALQGKRLGNVISTGGGPLTYSAAGSNKFTIRELLRPFEQTANLCGMHYLPPFVIHSTHALSEAHIEVYTQHYQHTLQRLQNTLLPALALDNLHYLNDLTN